MMGDFNDKLGRNEAGEKFIGRYDFGKRNERGEQLATMAETYKLFVGNSLF